MEERKSGCFLEGVRNRVFNPLQILGRGSQRLANMVGERLRQLVYEENGGVEVAGGLLVTACFVGSGAFLGWQLAPKDILTPTLLFGVLGLIVGGALTMDGKLPE